MRSPNTSLEGTTARQVNPSRSRIYTISRIYRIKHDEQEEGDDARERFLNPDNLANLENPAPITGFPSL